MDQAHAVDWTQVLMALIAMVGSAISAYFAFRSRRSSESADKQAGKSSFHALLSQQSADIALRASLRHPRVPTIPKVETGELERGPPGDDDDEDG